MLPPVRHGWAMRWPLAPSPTPPRTRVDRAGGRPSVPSVHRQPAVVKLPGWRGVVPIIEATQGWLNSWPGSTVGLPGV